MRICVVRSGYVGLVAAGCFTELGHELPSVENDRAARQADATLILTDWEEFSRLGLDRLCAAMKCPIMLDVRTMFSPEVVQVKEFTYVRIGRPTVEPARGIAASHS